MKLLSIIFIFVFSATAFGQGGMVFADKKNKVYYAAGCREIADIAQIDMVSFFTTKAAQEKGFARADKCNGRGVRPEQPAPTTIPQNPYASKPKENSFENKSLKYVADSVSKTMYPFHCAEATKIKTENRVPVFGLEEATEKGFTLSKICTKPKIAAAAKSAKEKTPALGKTTEAINTLAIKTYPESWADRPIILKAGISLPEPRDKEEFGEKRFAQAFILRDRSERMYIILQEGKAADILRKRIIFNDGFPVNGTFTFVINSDVYKTLGATGILQSFSLEQ